MNGTLSEPMSGVRAARRAAATATTATATTIPRTVRESGIRQPSHRPRSARWLQPRGRVLGSQYGPGPHRARYANFCLAIDSSWAARTRRWRSISAAAGFGLASVEYLVHRALVVWPRQ